MIGAELYPAAVRSGAPDLDSRVKLAANPATPPSLLAGLAADGAITVRAAVALNPSLPDSAQRQLARDSDERVRLLLTRKLAGALPGLSGPDESELRERTLGILTGLVRDEAVRIRSAVAASLAGLPDVPHDVILTLAHDHAVEVSGPVLRLSPLLSTADLLELVAAPPHGGTAVAIACRANLPASVADAIAATADSPAICALLANGSAAIQEGTLDALIACAADEPGWHTPLVRRPRLPDHAARALAEIVAGHLLQELATRTDLSAEVIAGIQHRLNAPAAPPAQPGAAETDLDHITQARHLEGCGTLGKRSCWRRCAPATIAGRAPSSRSRLPSRWTLSTARPRCAAQRVWSAWCGRQGSPCGSQARCRRRSARSRRAPSFRPSGASIFRLAGRDGLATGLAGRARPMRRRHLPLGEGGHMRR